MTPASTPDIQCRIVRAPMHKDGSPGLLYLRVRVERADRRLRPARVDLALNTSARAEAAQRALVLIKALRTLGVQVLGQFPEPAAPPPRRRRAKKAKRQSPPFLPGLDKFV